MKKAFILFFAVVLFILIAHKPIMENVPANNELAVTPSQAALSTPSQKPSSAPSPTEASSPTPAPTPTEAPKNSFDPYEIIKNMSDEELVGQLFLARCPELYEASKMAEEYHLGGYVLFGNHTQNETPDSLKAYIDEIQSASKLPMLIAVDEEGGTVTRISRYPQYRSNNFPSPRTLFNEGGIENILVTEKEKCELLKGLGFNVNLAPVCDITTDSSAFMYSRSLGQSADVTADFVSEVLKLYESENFGAVLKHFPGYGNNRDTHTGIAADNKELNELITNDLIPFFKGINEGCDAILVSHTFINAIDSELPGSLSPKVTAFLRDEMNFEGVIVTDDLYMEAITDLYGAKESAVLAIEAGADLLCSTEFTVQYKAVLEALEGGRIDRARLEESAAKILLWKHELDLI